MIHLRAGIEEGKFEFEFFNIQGSKVLLNMNYILTVMCWSQILQDYKSRYQDLFYCNASVKYGNPCNLWVSFWGQNMVLRLCMHLGFRCHKLFELLITLVVIISSWSVCMWTYSLHLLGNRVCSPCCTHLVVGMLMEAFVEIEWKLWVIVSFLSLYIPCTIVRKACCCLVECSSESTFPSI